MSDHPTPWRVARCGSMLEQIVDANGETVLECEQDFPGEQFANASLPRIVAAVNAMERIVKAEQHYDIKSIYDIVEDCTDDYERAVGDE